MREILDDDAARRALHTLGDEPVPPAVTTLDQVLRRGRRRVFVQRAGAVAGVVAVVAGIAVGTVVLRQGEPGGVTVATSSTSPPASPPASAPRREVLPGWELVELPSNGSGDPCEQPYYELPGEPAIRLLPEGVVKTSFYSAVKTALGAVEQPTSEWMDNSPKHGSPRGYVVVEVSMDNGAGQLQLEATRYGGTPLQMAAASITVYGNCSPPLRRTLDDGTVMQLYPVNGPDGTAPTQPLQIYRPDGREYIVTAAGYSKADMVPTQGGDGSMTIVGGRGKLPTTEAQLAAIAEGLVEGLN